MLLDGPVKQTVLLGPDGQNLDVDSDGNLAIRNKVWNPQTMAWESMKQSEVVVGALTVSGVAVSNWPTDQPVSGSVSVDNLPAIQPVSAVSLPLPSGAATSDKQDTLETLVDTLQELVQRLAPFASSVQVQGGIGLRVVPISAPSTAVTGPLTNAQYIATRAVGGIHYTQRTAGENLAAVQSNINNVTGA